MLVLRLVLLYILTRLKEFPPFPNIIMYVYVVHAPQVAQAHEWLLVCLVFALDFENKFYFKYT